MDFRLLGPLEVADGNRPLELGGVKQRSLLAILLLHAREVVSSDTLIDQLWGAAPPATASKSVQVYVSRLRKLLGEGRLVTQAPGYVMRVEPEELDLARFEQLAAEARRAAPETASRKLREALGLWRGPALADLAYEAFAQPEVARLEEMRLAALEARVEADLALGGHAELVGELESLVARHPLREGLRRQLMLALYRSGRQAESLAAYRAAREELAEELGLEPSEELRRLEQAVLRQDPALDVPEEPRSAAAPVQTRGTLLVVPRELPGLDALLALARPLAAAAPARELVIAAVVDAAELGGATAALAGRREELIAGGLATRTAAFTSPSPAEDLVRLAAQESVDLLLLGGGSGELDARTLAVLEQAPSDVAVLAVGGGGPREGPVIVPFGAAHHDWAALEVGAWVARAIGVPLRLIGAAGGGPEGRDASRLLADASLIVQRTAGIVAEPLLSSSGGSSLAALADGAGLLVVGLSDRWREEGLGRVRGELATRPPAPTLFVRRGARPGGLAPPESRTSFRWSLTGAA